MKHYKYQTVTTVDKVLSKMVCDCCGKEDEVGLRGSDVNEFSISFEYGSKFDLSKWDLDVCDSCLEMWTNTFKHGLVDIVKSNRTL